MKYGEGWIYPNVKRRLTEYRPSSVNCLNIGNGADMKCESILIWIGLLLIPGWAACQDFLKSWNDTAAKQSIISFVEKVTKEGSPDFVPPAERIATLDNDGTLSVRAAHVFPTPLRARSR